MNTDWILPGKSRGWRAGGTARLYRVSGHHLPNSYTGKIKAEAPFSPTNLNMLSTFYIIING